jgi:hypothetical protein
MKQQNDVNRMGCKTTPESFRYFIKATPAMDYFSSLFFVFFLFFFLYDVCLIIVTHSAWLQQ